MKTFLDVAVAFFDRADGRDKLGKLLQNGFRFDKHYAPDGSARKARSKAMQESLSDFRGYCKFFKWLKLYKEFTEVLAEERAKENGKGALGSWAMAELVAIGGDIGYKLSDNVEFLCEMRFLSFAPERCERAAKTFQYVAYSLDLLVGLRKLLQLRALLATTRQQARRARQQLGQSGLGGGSGKGSVKEPRCRPAAVPSPAFGMVAAGPAVNTGAVKRIEREVERCERQARLALLWSIADLADWLRCTPKFCEIYGLFGLKKHDGWSGALGVLVGIIGTFKVYRKVA